MAQVKRFEITNGPSKFDLMISLFVGARGDQCAWVNFDTDNGGNISVVINEIRRIETTGDTWFFRGASGAVDTHRAPEFRVEGYFSSRTRRGWIEHKG